MYHWHVRAERQVSNIFNGNYLKAQHTTMRIMNKFRDNRKLEQHFELQLQAEITNRVVESQKHRRENIKFPEIFGNYD